MPGRAPGLSPVSKPQNVPRSIHAQMLRSVLGAPLSFFDSSPTGRVLNRFLQDMQNIDSYVPNVITDQITRTLSVLIAVAG